MSIKLKSIKLQNFKKFQEIQIPIFPDNTILIGDNESGKSSLLTAIDIVLSGSRNKVEHLGLQNLMNYDCIQKFMSSDRSLEHLPETYIDLFIEPSENEIYYGSTNSTKKDSYGIRFKAKPNEDYHEDIKEILSSGSKNFPFEFYSIEFRYFSDRSYSSYTKTTNHLLIDNSTISNKLAISQYIKNVYSVNVDLVTRIKLKNSYREAKEKFSLENLKGLNQNKDLYEFALKSNSDSNLDTDLNLEENGIPIQNRGKGRQCFIKTDFALQKKSNTLDCLLLEEPENHLSHSNMHRLINRIKETLGTQIIIATHNSLISNRLDLRNVVLLNSQSNDFTCLKHLDKKTAEFFIKAPDNNILEFVLSSKVILVEGDAEYILIKKIIETELKTNFESTGIHVISVGGISFPRYLEIAKLLKIKTAVITDNDGNYQINITNRYSSFQDTDSINIFADKSNKRRTFEISIYESNKELCERLFKKGRRTLTVQEYMLQNKTEVALQLLKENVHVISCPEYIKKAIEWIR